MKTMKNKVLFRHYLTKSLLCCCVYASALAAVAEEPVKNRLLKPEDIAVHGVTKSVAENLRLHISGINPMHLNDQALIRQRLQKPVSAALQAYGFYHATVNFRFRDQSALLSDKAAQQQSSQRQHSQQPSAQQHSVQQHPAQQQAKISKQKHDLVIDILPGQPVVWSQPEITLNTSDPVISEFLTRHPFNTGEPLNHQVYEDFKQKLLSLASRRGYLDATYSRHQLQINLKQNRATAVLDLPLGNRYRLQKITFNGSGLAQNRLALLARVNTGSYYSTDQLGDIYNRLLNSGYFASVDIDTEKNPPDSVHLHVTLKDAPSHRYTLGAGFGTDTGPRLQASWQRPRVNRRGDSVQTQLKASGVSNELSSQYKMPWGHSPDHFVTWKSGWKEKDVEDTNSEILSTGLAYHNIAESGWQYHYQINLEKENFQQGSEQEQSVTYVIPSASWSHTKFKGDRRNPDSGYKIWFGVEAGSTELGSDTDFVKLTAGLRYLGQWADKNQISVRLEGGAIYSGDFQDVPASRRFFTGGDQTVRGFDFESLSPVDAQGELIGGEKLNIASLEYRRQWSPGWQWAVFTDSGRAYDNSADAFQTSAGFGIRWRSPIGVVAFDLAKPVDSEVSDSIRLHVYMGLAL